MNFPSGNLVGLLGEPHDEAFVRHVLEGTLKALASYHERGRSYGQVRPHTIYLAGDGRIRLGDVRATIVSTQVEAPEGLAKYLPPETLAAEVFGEVGPPTDIYALGLVAVELLTGPRFESLFEGIADDPLGGDLAWMRWHGTADFRLPPVRQIVPGLSAGFAAVLDRMIAKRVADRPTTAEQALAMLAGNEPIAPIAPAAPTRDAPVSNVPADVDHDRIRETQEEPTSATVFFDDSDSHVDGAEHGIAPLPVWQNDIRATPKVTDTAHEDAPVAPPIAPVPPVAPVAPSAPAIDAAMLRETVAPPPRSQQPVRGTMMPDEDDSAYGAAAAALPPITASVVETKPSVSARKETPAAEPRRSRPAAESGHPADHLPPAMKLANMRRRGPFDHPAVLALLSIGIIVAVGYLLFVFWPIDDGTRKIEITSDPPGAHVIVDGLASGETTPTELKLKIGKRDVRLTMDGFYDAKKSVEVAKDGENAEVAVVLTKIPTFRVVRLETEPADAAVHIDGSPTPFESRTPTEMTLTLRTHKLVFKKPGFLDTSAEITVQLGDGPQVERVTLSPVPKRVENLIVKIDPANAQLTAGGNAIQVVGGQATVPLEEGGSVELAATAEGFGEWRRTVLFADAAQSRFTVMAELDPYLSFVPAEATVTVNDAPLKLEAGRALLAAAPNQRYRVVATAKGYDKLDVTLSRADLVTQSFEIKLSPGPRPPAALRQLADGRYVHDGLEKAGVPLYFVVVEPGEFVFGAKGQGLRPGEFTQRDAQINEPYLIATTEVSVRQYAEFAKQAGDKAGTKWKPADINAAANLPVTNVSHEQAKGFAAFVSGKLPTEQQWERAARGTKGREFPWDGDDAPSSERCNLGFALPIPERKLSAVDALPEGATPEGVLNMLGNAAEWCEEIYKLGHGDDAQTPGLGRYPTIRGGSYQDPFNNTSRDARATMRANATPDGRADVGIRVVVPFVRGK